MPLDPSIILGQVKSDPIPNPFDLIEGLQRLKSNQQSIESNAALMRERQQQEEQRRRTMAESMQLDAIVKKHASPTGDLDTSGILADMESAGMSSLLFSTRKQILDQAKTESETRRETIANNHATLGVAAGLVNSFLKNTPDDQLPLKFQTLKADVTKLAGPDWAARLGDTPDRDNLKRLAESDAPTLAANLKAQGEAYDQAIKAMERAQAATKNDRDFAIAAAKEVPTLRNAISSMLTLSGHSPDEYAKAYGDAKAGIQWMPTESQKLVLQGFSPTLTPGALEQARRAGMTQPELSTERRGNAQLSLEQQREQRLQDAQGLTNLPPTDANQPSGDAYLKTLPQGDQLMVKALAEGRQQWPSGSALRAPFWQGMIKKVLQYDPNMDTAVINQNTRSKVRQEFLTGKSAQQVRALNTAIGHLDQLSDAVEALNNSDVKAYNRAANFLASEFGWKGKTDFDTIAARVAQEVTRVWRGTGGSEKDIERDLETLTTNNAPGQLHGSIGNLGGLIKSQIDSLDDQYRQGMGTKNITLVTPNSAKVLSKLEALSGQTPPQVLAAGPGRHEFGNGQIWEVSPDGKSARRIK